MENINKTLGLTQKEFGEKIGTSLQVVGNYETGFANPGRQYFHKLNKALNVNVSSCATKSAEIYL